MMNEPVFKILPKKADRQLQEALNEYSNLLDELINYGTHILSWDIERKRDTIIKNIPSVFFRNIIELGDSISILIKKSSIEPSKIIFRSLLENSFYLLYMIEKDEEKRASCYMVYRILKDVKSLNRLIRTEKSSKQLVKSLEKDDPDFNLDEYYFDPNIEKLKDQKLDLLKEDEYNKAYDEYKRIEGIHKYPNWYSLYDGPSNFQQLSGYLNRTNYYEFIYRKYSDIVHISDVLKGFTITDKIEKVPKIIQIRNWENCHEVFLKTISILLEVYSVYIEKHIPEKYTEYKKWYDTFEFQFDDIKNKGDLVYRI